MYICVFRIAKNFVVSFTSQLFKTSFYVFNARHAEGGGGVTLDEQKIVTIIVSVKKLETVTISTRNSEI